MNKINEICADLQYNWETHRVGCLTHKILIGSQIDCNKSIYFNLSTHIVTYTSLLSTSSIEAYKFVKIK